VLQAWKDLLQNTVEDSMPAALSLEQESPVLHVSSCSFHCQSLHRFSASIRQSFHCFSADMQQTLLVLQLKSCLYAADSVNPVNKKLYSPYYCISSLLLLLLSVIGKGSGLPHMQPF